MRLKKIISGAQTGADQAGLAAAITLGLETGGWMPKGRRTHVGALPLAQFEAWKLQEHTSPNYPPRTEANVRDADVTLWFGRMASLGYRCTYKACLAHGKPMHVNPPVALLRVLARTYAVWNVAGNREETNSGLFQRTYDTLVEALRQESTP